MATVPTAQAFDLSRRLQAHAEAQRVAAELREAALLDLEVVCGALCGDEYLSRRRRWELAALLVSVEVRLAGGTA